MIIKVEPGVVVQLDRKRATSVKGGEYTLPDDLPERERKRILATKGVTESKGTPAPKKEA